MLLPGRNCTYNSQCYSGKCVDKVCRGRSSAETCSRSEECDINLACITSTVAPYKSSCQEYLEEGEYCLSDYECPFDMVCWAESSAEAQLRLRKCHRWAFYNVTYTFGWISQYWFDHDNIRANGQICNTGYAYQDPADPYQAICSELQSIQSD